MNPEILARVQRGRRRYLVVHFPENWSGDGEEEHVALMADEPYWWRDRAIDRTQPNSELPAAVREALAALQELVDAVAPVLGTMNYYFGVGARAGASRESIDGYTRIRDAVATAGQKLARVDAVRTGS